MFRKLLLTTSDEHDVALWKTHVSGTLSREIGADGEGAERFMELPPNQAAQTPRQHRRTPLLRQKNQSLSKLVQVGATREGWLGERNTYLTRGSQSPWAAGISGFNDRSMKASRYTG